MNRPFHRRANGHSSEQKAALRRYVGKNIKARQIQKLYFPGTFRFQNFAAQGLPDPEVIF